MKDSKQLIKGINSSKELINLIKENGDWIDPKI